MQPYGLLGRMVLNPVARCRPLNLVEDRFLKSSKLLPSVLNQLRDLSPFAALEAKPEAALVVTGLSGLCDGEFCLASPRDFIDGIEAFQLQFDKKLEDLKRLCRQFFAQGIQVSMAFVDGKVAITTDNEFVMDSSVIPLIKECLPWNGSWNVGMFMRRGNSSLTQLSPSTIGTSDVEASSAQEAESFRYCDEFSEITLKDILPNASPDEIEVFTTWSNA